MPPEPRMERAVGQSHSPVLGLPRVRQHVSYENQQGAHRGDELGHVRHGTAQVCKRRHQRGLHLCRRRCIRRSLPAVAGSHPRYHSRHSEGRGNSDGGGGGHSHRHGHSCRSWGGGSGGHRRRVLRNELCQARHVCPHHLCHPLHAQVQVKRRKCAHYSLLCQLCVRGAGVRIHTQEERRGVKGGQPLIDGLDALAGPAGRHRPVHHTERTRGGGLGEKCAELGGTARHVVHSAPPLGHGGDGGGSRQDASEQTRELRRRCRRGDRRGRGGGSGGGRGGQSRCGCRRNGRGHGSGCRRRRWRRHDSRACGERRFLRRHLLRPPPLFSLRYRDFLSRRCLSRCFRGRHHRRGVGGHLGLGCLLLRLDPRRLLHFQTLDLRSGGGGGHD
mmetsp:Transcript_1143/g.2511  ORF Transcript_1143/g.2511 Transcript_1143/m.2511 type:complete len:387 (-) Transcript_1143:526-1686(-)